MSRNRIPVEQVARLTRSIAEAEYEAISLVGVVPFEGGSDRVELVLSVSNHEGRASVVVDRAVPHADLQRAISKKLHLVARPTPGE